MKEIRPAALPTRSASPEPDPLTLRTLTFPDFESLTSGSCI
jgi:hypothetical protein